MSSGPGARRGGFELDIVLGTSNPTKREKLRWVLAGLPLRPVDGPPLNVAEAGQSFRDNAAAKALAYSTGGLAIASDGGLVIPAAAGEWDPLRTGRQGLVRLHELAARLDDRRVRWQEALAIARQGQVLALFEANQTEGVLSGERRGRGEGFWAWELFLVPGLGKTLAELSASELEQADRTWNALKAEAQGFLGGLLNG